MADEQVGWFKKALTVLTTAVSLAAQIGVKYLLVSQFFQNVIITLSLAVLAVIGKLIDKVYSCFCVIRGQKKNAEKKWLPAALGLTFTEGMFDAFFTLCTTGSMFVMSGFGWGLPLLLGLGRIYDKLAYKVFLYTSQKQPDDGIWVDITFITGCFVCLLEISISYNALVALSQHVWWIAIGIAIAHFATSIHVKWTAYYAEAKDDKKQRTASPFYRMAIRWLHLEPVTDFLGIDRSWGKWGSFALTFLSLISVGLTRYKTAVGALAWLGVPALITVYLISALTARLFDIRACLNFLWPSVKTVGNKNAQKVVASAQKVEPKEMHQQKPVSSAKEPLLKQAVKVVVGQVAKAKLTRSLIERCAAVGVSLVSPSRKRLWRSDQEVYSRSAPRPSKRFRRSATDPTDTRSWSAQYCNGTLASLSYAHNSKKDHPQTPPPPRMKRASSCPTSVDLDLESPTTVIGSLIKFREERDAFIEATKIKPARSLYPWEVNRREAPNSVQGNGATSRCASPAKI